MFGMVSKSLLWKAYLAGFKQSAEGFNGEYPWYRGEEEQERIKESLRSGGRDNFENWFDENVVEFTCIDCEKEVSRPRKDTIDIDGLTPKRCGSCTLDRMAEQ